MLLSCLVAVVLLSCYCLVTFLLLSCYRTVTGLLLDCLVTVLSGSSDRRGPVRSNQETSAPSDRQLRRDVGDYSFYRGQLGEHRTATTSREYTHKHKQARNAARQSTVRTVSRRGAAPSSSKEARPSPSIFCFLKGAPFPLYVFL